MSTTTSTTSTTSTTREVAAPRRRWRSKHRPAWDEDPGPDVQVLVAGDTAELGLWYRLAPVTYLGGTLVGTGSPRHPFEPASLGSAIIHGPATATHAAEWLALDRARGARAVTSAAALRVAVEDLTAPDQAGAGEVA